MQKQFRATDDDLPGMLLSPVAAAKLKIKKEADALGVEITLPELSKFAILLLAIEEK
jgi:hypothetical protein